MVRKNLYKRFNSPGTEEDADYFYGIGNRSTTALTFQGRDL